MHGFSKVKGAGEGCSSVRGLIWMSRLNVVALAYDAAANVVQCFSLMLEERWTVTYALRGARKYRLNGYNNKMFQPNLTEEF